MEFLSNYGLFVLETFTLVIAILLLIAGIASISRKEHDEISIESLSEKHHTLVAHLQKNITGEKPANRKERKQQKKANKERPNLYVLDFHGDIKASQAESLRKAVTAVLSCAKDKDAVMVRLDSPGGAVNGYGLAASQLQRIKDKKIPLTVCIDKVAASGGYLMACVADTIVAAPFAIIGSIGVVAQLPNFHRWLQKHNIDFELLTAGEYKRTLTVFGENTDKGREKFQEDLELIHVAFRKFVQNNRQQLDIDTVATGEHWLASDAFELRLIDKLETSDDYILNRMDTFNIWHINCKTPKTVLERMLKPATQLFHPWA